MYSVGLVRNEEEKVENRLIIQYEKPTTFSIIIASSVSKNTWYNERCKLFSLSVCISLYGISNGLNKDKFNVELIVPSSPSLLFKFFVES